MNVYRMNKYEFWIGESWDIVKAMYISETGMDEDEWRDDATREAPLTEQELIEQRVALVDENERRIGKEVTLKQYLDDNPEEAKHPGPLLGSIY